MFFSFGYLSLEFYFFIVDSIFARWIYAYLIDGDLRSHLYLAYSLHSNMFYSATTRLLRKELSGH